MKTFRLVRDEDETGISGTGIVAEGVQFTNGKVVLGWLGSLGVPSLGVFDSVSEVEQVHGHEGKTRIEWEGEGVSVPEATARVAVAAKPPPAPEPRPEPKPVADERAQPPASRGGKEESVMRREDLDAEELATVKAMLHSYVQEIGNFEEAGLTEDEVVEAQLDLLERGLIEIVLAPEDEDGNFMFAIVPTGKTIAEASA